MLGQAFIDTFKCVPVAIVKATSKQSEKRNDVNQMREYDRSSWMFSLVEGTKMHQLCLAGTHHSACFKLYEYVACGSCWVKCQAWDIATQLENGVRFLDLRYSRPTHFGHGPAIFAPSRIVAHDILSFLQNHPTEIIVCSLRRNSNYKSYHGNTHKFENDERYQEYQMDEETIANNVQHDPIDLFYQTLQALQTSNKNTGSNVQIVLVKDMQTHMNYYHQMTIKELTCQGSRGMIMIYDWNIWQGSWSYTRHNQPKKLLEKSKQWTLQNNEKEIKDLSPPRILEYVITIDHGNFLTILKLGLIESIETVAAKLDLQSQTLLDTPYLSKVDALFVDFPSTFMLQSIIQWNITWCQRNTGTQQTNNNMQVPVLSPTSDLKV